MRKRVLFLLLALIVAVSVSFLVASAATETEISSFDNTSISAKFEEGTTMAACPKCGGEIAIRSAKNRSVYYSCENYPTCDFSSWDKPTNEKCPNCNKLLFVKKLKDSKSLICADAECGYKRALSEDDEY